MKPVGTINAPVIIAEATFFDTEDFLEAMNLLAKNQKDVEGFGLSLRAVTLAIGKSIEGDTGLIITVIKPSEAKAKYDTMVYAYKIQWVKPIVIAPSNEIIPV